MILLRALKLKFTRNCSILGQEITAWVRHTIVASKILELKQEINKKGCTRQEGLPSIHEPLYTP